MKSSVLFDLVGGDDIRCPKCGHTYNVDWSTECGDPCVGEYFADCPACGTRIEFGCYIQYTQPTPESVADATDGGAVVPCVSLLDRWEYIKADPDGAMALLLLLKNGKGTPKDFDTMVDRIILARVGAGLHVLSNNASLHLRETRS